MNQLEYLLAIIPPVMAIAVEFLSPFKARFFEKQAHELIDRELNRSSAGNSGPAKHAIDVAEKLIATSSHGAASLVGAAPTLVSFLTSGFAIAMASGLREALLIGLALGVACFALIMWRVFGGRNLHDVAARPVRFFQFSISRTTVVSAAVYFTNAALIVAASAVHCLSDIKSA